MDHQTNVQKEFSRQAEPMATAAAFQATDVLGRIAAGLGTEKFARILDLACGPGIVTEAIAPCANEIIGVDVTPKMIELAEARARKANLTHAKFQLAPAEQLPFPDAHFNAIVTRLSFHHFVDLPLVLKELRRTLTPHGRLVVADLISSADPAEAKLHNALEILRDPTHIRMFPHAELLIHLKNAGFTLLTESAWQQPRNFTEWASIVADPTRTAPLHEVMRSLAQAGKTAGINLREIAGEVLFDHQWVLLVAQS